MKIRSINVLNDGMSEEDAQASWDSIVGFAGYGFNKSHSVAYTLLSYQMMWLKTYYPIEFYAAALALLDEDKLPALLADAKAAGIELDMPDINLSTNRFEILTDTRLIVPFQRIKGISEKTAMAVLDARKAGKFVSIADLQSRVEARKCNVRHVELLQKVGAFAAVEPTEPPSNSPARIPDQIELIPGLVTEMVHIHRDMYVDKATKEEITNIVTDYRTDHGPMSLEKDGIPLKPMFGKEAAFMIVLDAPSSQEEAFGTISFSNSTDAIIDAMKESDLVREDAYWTALIKRPKRNKTISTEEIKVYKPYLDREIATLKPPVIVLCGSFAVRAVFPDFKGKVFDRAGEVIYSKELDTNFVIGFSPGEIYYSPEKQEIMNKVFEVAAKALGNT